MALIVIKSWAGTSSAVSWLSSCHGQAFHILQECCNTLTGAWHCAVATIIVEFFLVPFFIFLQNALLSLKLFHTQKNTA